MRQRIVDFALAKGSEGNGRDVESVAEVTSRALKALLAELQSVVGQLAARALYVRSLHLARSSFVRPDISSDAETIDALLLLLRQDLDARDEPEATRAAGALLHALIELLVSLIGEHLTYRMLRTAWKVPASELSFEDKTP